ncbi:MAG: hypothetical protein EAZ33_09960 [Oscillatoriales cyanobacterium]|nr:MAG: hypothetical protein EAZ33_09960 [Oscillatoriales cyanobacterium]
MPQNGYQQGLSANPSAIAYQKRLYPWAIAKLMPNMQRTVVGRFRRRSDADGHLLCLRQLMPQASLLVVFEFEIKLKTLS